jgi:hypothetical protein
VAERLRFLPEQLRIAHSWTDATGARLNGRRPVVPKGIERIGETPNALFISETNCRAGQKLTTLALGSAGADLDYGTMNDSFAQGPEPAAL